MRRTSRTLAFGLGILLSLGCASARADEAPISDEVRTRARGLGEEGNALFDKGDYKAALDMYERAGALVNVPTLGLKSARCLDKLGRLIEASERYLMVTRTTLPPDALDVHKEAIVSAEQERQALIPRIPSLVVSIGHGTGRVTLDGKPYAAALLDVKSAIDPGKHQIDLRGPDGDDSQVFEVQEGRSFTIRLDPHRKALEKVSAPPRGWMSPLHGAGLGSLVLGAAGIASGIGTTVALASKKSNLDGPCGAALAHCPASTNTDSYNSLRGPSTASWVLGGVLAATGILMVAIPNRERNGPATTALSLGPSGASMTGEF